LAHDAPWQDQGRLAPVKFQIHNFVHHISPSSSICVRCESGTPLLPLLTLLYNEGIVTASPAASLPLVARTSCCMASADVSLPSLAASAATHAHGHSVRLSVWHKGAVGCEGGHSISAEYKLSCNPVLLRLPDEMVCVMMQHMQRWADAQHQKQ
jgi:hypothetical protein